MSIERDPASPHPPVERLAAFARGDLATAEASGVGEHVAACRECRRIVLDRQGRSDREDEVLDTAWTGLRSRLRDEAGPAVERSGTPRRRPALPGLVAASLLLAAALGVGFLLGARAGSRETEARIDRFERELRELRGPRANVLEIDLFPRGTLRQGDEVPRLTVAASTGLVLLRLLLVETGEAGPHRLEIATAAGPVASLDGIEPDALGKASVVLHRDALPSGLLRLRLYPVTAGGAGPVTEYVVRVADENARE